MPGDLLTLTLDDQHIFTLDHLKAACEGCSLAGLCLPVGLEREEIEQLERIVKHSHPLHKDDHLFQAGDRFRSLYAVRSGSVKTYLPSSDGGEQILGFHLPGEVVGLDAIDSGSHTCSARMLETSSVCEIPFSRLDELAETIPSIYRQVCRLLSKELSQESEMLILLGKKTADERLATFLSCLSRRLEKRGFSATEFNLSMSRHEIGSYLGLAVETVSRLFTRFQEDGLIEVERKHVRLLDPQRLYDLATPGGHSSLKKDSSLSGG